MKLTIEQQKMVVDTIAAYTEVINVLMPYIEPFALKNSAKGDEYWALMTQMFAVQMMAKKLAESIISQAEMKGNA